MLRRWGLILIAAFLLFVLWQGHTSAQSASNLQADLFELRSQVNQLRSQVAQLNRQTSPNQRLSPSRIPRSPTDPSDPQMIERLAVLAIEAKDRLTALEGRVAALEKRSESDQ